MMEKSLTNMLLSLVEATEALCVIVEGNDLAGLSECLDARGKLLKEYEENVGQWKDSREDADNHSSIVAQQGPLVQKLMQVDLKFVTLASAKQEKLYTKLKQAQNQKLLLAYST
jgi:hypothetical protein